MRIFPNAARYAALAALLMLLGVWAVSRQMSSEIPGGIITFSGPIMGTAFSVKSANSSEELDWDRIEDAVFRELQRINGLMSTWLPNSELSRFNASTRTDWFEISEDTYRVLREALTLAEMTDGALDVTVGPLVDLWGFGAGSGNDGDVSKPDESQITSILSTVGHRNIELREKPPALRKRIPQLQVDLSSLAKGYAVDRVAILLNKAGATDYLVDIGGELRAAGKKAPGQPWRVAVEKPDGSGRLPLRIYRLIDTGVATSGDYRNYFEQDGQRFSHLIDPRTGRPVPLTLASLTVFDESTMRADALATGMLVMGAESAFAFAEKNDIPSLMVTRTNSGLELRETEALRRLDIAETGS